MKKFDEPMAKNEIYFTFMTVQAISILFWQMTIVLDNFLCQRGGGRWVRKKDRQMRADALRTSPSRKKARIL